MRDDQKDPQTLFGRTESTCGDHSETEGRYKALFETVDDGFCIVEVDLEAHGGRADYRVVEANPAFYRQTGFPEAIFGRWLRDVAPELEEHWFETYARVARAGEQARFEQRSEYLKRWFDVHAFPIGAPERQRVAIHFNDVTARRQAEELLRKVNADLERKLPERALVRGRTWEVTPDIMCVLNFDGRFEQSNPAWRTVLGWSEAEVANAVLFDFIHPDDLARSRAAWTDVVERGVPALRFENRYRNKEGGWRWLSWVGVPDHGKVYCSARDITAQKEQAETLAARTAERDRMWKTSPDLMLVIDFDGVFRRVNPAWKSVLGYEPEELVGHHVNEYVVPEDHADTVDAYELAAKGGRPKVVNRYRHKDGTLRWISWTAAPDGDMAYAIGRDVTAERENAALIRRYRDIVEAIPTPICAFDTQYRLIAFNRAHNVEFCRVNGFETKIGDVFPDLFIPEQSKVMRGFMARALSGERFTIVDAFGRPELGTPFWEISYTPLCDDEGQIVGAFHQAIDISDRVLAEAELEAAQEALRQSQKLEAMGQLTGGVAHDFNNLLTPIIGPLDMIVRRGLGSDRERRLLEAALQSAERARILVQRLLAFARRQPLQPAAVDIGRLVEGMAGLIGATLGPTIDVRVSVDPRLPLAHADGNQVEMALLNLSVNARDAMPNGGRLNISATHDRLGKENTQGLAPGEYVRLSVVDCGVGMDDTTRARAVEPFFSTKGIGKGTGLGLSMVHGLAAQLGGGLTIESEPGRGTSVHLWLPVSAAPRRDAEAASRAVTQDAAARGVALVVDDEALVRLSVVEMLMDLGFAVVEATSGDEALALIRSGKCPDLLVTDHLMPRMSGVELARAARLERPELPILIISGYADVEAIAPDLPRLSKPFRPTDLEEWISKLLA